jgi:GST-like protein
MIDFYMLTSPNAQKIFIMLEELELPYRAIPVDVFKGDHFKPEFVRLNPNAKIPVIVDHEGPDGRPYTVFESGAILLYLADKTGRLLPKDTIPRFDVMQWLMIQLTGVGPMFGQLTHFKRFAPAGNDYSLSRYQTEVHRLYDVLERRLGSSPYLGGAEYTIADVATFPWTRDHDWRGVKFDDHPHFARWFGEACDRQDRRDQVKPRYGKAGGSRPAVWARPLRKGVIQLSARIKHARTAYCAAQIVPNSPAHAFKCARSARHFSVPAAAREGNGDRSRSAAAAGDRIPAWRPRIDFRFAVETRRCVPGSSVRSLPHTLRQGL